MHEWKKFWWKVDVVAVLGIVLATGYCAYSERVGAEASNLWSNLAIEIIGVWLSVRIIAAIVERRDKFHKSRFHLLDNLTYFYDTARQVIRYKTGFSEEEFLLKKELKYFDIRWETRRKFFSNTETEKVLSLRGLMIEIFGFVQDIEQQRLTPNFDEENISYHEVKELLRVTLDHYEQILEKLRLDIWEESHPDIA